MSKVAPFTAHAEKLLFRIGVFFSYAGKISEVYVGAFLLLHLPHVAKETARKRGRCCQCAEKVQLTRVALSS